ncbi:MAG: oxidoreductase [Subtercola sp.]|nr:oxidoreductase [Subtercola sp.]
MTPASTGKNSRLLTRAAFATAHGLPPSATGIRIVHLGLGAFHRAHQAWYTAHADDTSEWGIAAFTGRSPTAADELRPQGGLFTLIERDDAADRAEVIGSIVEAVDGADLARFVELLSAPKTAIVTITVTEAGYRMTADGLPDDNDVDLQADREWLASNLPEGRSPSDSGRLLQNLADRKAPDRANDAPTTTLGRLLLGLAARRLAGAGPIAVVPCDNMPSNGRLLSRVVRLLAAEVSSPFATWVAEQVSFVSTSVDRITPRMTPADQLIAERLTGWHDNAPVVTEPFSDWVLSGEFPAGRPAWERAGARFVDDIEPFENRKLWLLNGAHSLLAYAGLLRGHGTVAEAMADETCRGWVTGFWNEAARRLSAEQLDLDDYREALLRRFSNTRIEHRLSQISAEGVLKLRVRIVPTLLAERAAGRDGAACVRVIGSWAALVLSGAELVDSAGKAVSRAVSSDQPVAALLAVIDPRLADDENVLAAVSAVVAEHAAPHAR